MKQTAVEWLVEQLNEKIDFSPLDKWDMIRDIIQQAKAMEKEQMDKVAEDWWNEGASYMHDGGRKYESFEKYYNETFKTKEI
jgi:uncharacterized protein with ParB-like and HNH nuclease domain